MANVNPIIQVSGGGGGGISYTVDVFTSSGTYTKPANLDYAYLLMVSGGGGAGSGRRGAASTNRSGGIASNGGCYLAKFNNTELNATETVTVGAGGVGGAAQTVDNTNGNAGTLGGATNFKYGGTFNMSGGNTLGGFAQASGVALFVGTCDFTANRRAILSNYTQNQGMGNNTVSDALRALGGSPSTQWPFTLHNPSSRGGQISNANIQINAGILTGFYDDTNTLINEIAGTAPETAAVQPTQFYTFGQFLHRLFPWFNPADANYNIGRGGLGGGCGDTAGTVAGFTGANGLGYGAAGGGGGASTNGANSGAGGNGVGGIVIIVNVLT